ncbi:hypothetical protein GN958_ATG04031 [Phytophthora infestans]|uniref:Uncharacterized protein n=1 Tax=Phytophthora infestans TaxID=4787 RepID=A0A8S9V3W1_PHYIN|nr:hypothetical protein GN958_ATG04031 [Phytophthora infestans]
MVLIIHPRYRQVSPPVAFKTAISANKSTAKQWGFEVGNLRPSNEDPRLGTSEKPKRSGSASPGAVGSGTTPAVNARSAVSAIKLLRPPFREFQVAGIEIEQL